MTDTVISVEKLSKRYLVGHQAARSDRLYTFREAIARGARNFARKAVDMAGGRQIVQGDQIEQFWALKDISFEVKRGEVLGIIGRNGAGKSTLLKILSRVTQPTSGRVRIKGRVGSLLEVGTGFHPELTGRENIFLNGTILGMTRAEIKRKLDAIVDFSGVEKFLDTPVKRYSSGMYVRLAFAVAAHLEPEIFVVDEVLAVGDAEFQKKCLGQMESVAKHGRTVLLVSHNMNFIERLCGRVCLIDRGRLTDFRNNVRQAVTDYLAAGNSEAIWRAGKETFKNGYFEPEQLEVRSTQPDWSPGSPFSNQYPVEVLVSGTVHQTAPGLNIGVAIYDRDGTLIFWTLTTDTAEGFWPPLRPGQVQLQTTIPERLLNEGQYRMELLVSIHNAEWVIEPGARGPSVVYSIQGGLSDSPLWYERRPGMLGLVLPWRLAAELSKDDLTG